MCVEVKSGTGGIVVRPHHVDGRRPYQVVLGRYPHGDMDIFEDGVLPAPKTLGF